MATTQLWANNAATTMNATGLANAAMSFTVSASGSEFPSPGAGEYNLVTVYELNGSGVEINVEVLEISGRSGDVFTIATRNYENDSSIPSGGYTYPSGSGVGNVVYVSLRATKKTYDNFAQKSAMATGVWSFLAAPSSANFAAALTDETGTGAVMFGTSPTVTTSLIIGGTGFRFTGDFSANNSAGFYFQSNTSNASTYVNCMPSGSGTTSGFRAICSSDPANTTTFNFNNTGTDVRIAVNALGTGSAVLPFTFNMYATERGRVDYQGNWTFGGSATSSSLYVAAVASSVNYVKISGAATGSAVTSEAAGSDTNITHKLTAKGTGKVQTTSVALFDKGVQTTKAAIGSSDIDLTLGSVFTKTISGNTTFTVSNVPSTGTVASFILDLTNGGSATVTWWSGVKWDSGVAPALTSSGRDVLGFFTHDGGTTWNGFLLGKAMA